jgi:hypothetical protein
MEVFLAGELLPHKLGPNDLAVAFDETAMRLVLEDDRRDSGHDQRVGNAGDQRKGYEKGNRRPEFFPHDPFSSQMQR